MSEEKYDNNSQKKIEELESITNNPQASQADKTNAMLKLGLMYYSGNSGEVDKNKAIEWFEKSASAGNTSAMFNLGVMYYTGDGINMDKNKAFEWYEKAANAGHNYAMLNLGSMYDNGHGVRADKNKAIEWFEKATDAGNVMAMCKLGSIYFTGNDVETDKKAFEWYEKAANAGDSDAMFMLGCFYYKGRGVKADKNKAIEWLEKAANFSSTEGMFLLGLLYDTGDGTDLNKSKAIEWYEKAANAGNASAMFNLGLMYGRNYSDEINKNKATGLLQKAIESNPSEFYWCRPLVDLSYNSQHNFAIITEAISHLDSLNDRCRNLLEAKFTKPKEERPKTVTHFTDSRVLAESMLPNLSGEDINNIDQSKGNSLWLYNTIYANDPLEGHALVLYAQYSSEKKNILEFFKPDGGCTNCELDKSLLHSNVYSVSFTVASDNLPLWRAYGKNGEGVGITIPTEQFRGRIESMMPRDIAYTKVKTAYQNQLIKPVPNDRPAEKTTKHQIDKDDLSEINTKHLSRNDMYLCKVLYGKVHINIQTKQDSNHEFEKLLEAIDKPLEKLLKITKNVNSELKKVIRECVQITLGPVLFLCKDSAYETEQEWRVLVPVSPTDKRIKLDEGKRDSKICHTFIPTENFLFEDNGYEITIGPRVQDKFALEQEIKWRLIQLKLRVNVQIKHSNIQYR